MKDLQDEGLADSDTTSLAASTLSNLRGNAKKIRIAHPDFDHESSRSLSNDVKVNQDGVDTGSSGRHSIDSDQFLDSEEPEELDNSYKQHQTKASAPPNPFARTLATLEGTEEHITDTTKPDKGTKSSTTPKSMDVDSFTQLLLTGEDALPPQPVPKAGNAFVPGQDSTSSTETSSISRQSLQEPLSDTPRSSYDQQRHDDWIDRSERHKPPPPPPKSKHGKTIPTKGPQIVSFDDFELSIPSQLELATTKSQDQELVRKTSHSKPLPPPPSEQPKESPDQQNLENRETGHLSRSASEKKSAPPLPLARRSTITKRARGNTVSSIASVNEDTPSSYPPSIADGITSPKAAPPPPPTRRHGSSSNIQSPSLSDSSRMGDLMSPTMVERTPSSSQVSLASPPPPPTRRRSSKASLEPVQNLVPSASHSRRSSSEAPRPSVDSQRRVSSAQTGHPIIEETDDMESPKHNLPHRASTSSAKDILADMDAFAKELEEIRSKSKVT